MLKNELVYLSSEERENNMVDLFAGCGGSGGGLLAATDILKVGVRGTFVNHWDRAIEIHAENHPEHRHMVEDLFLLDPAVVFPAGSFCSLLWASPSCTFFSLARGASCVNEQSRSHALSVLDWVKHLRPEAVIIENVAEFRNWCGTIQKRGPDPDGELIWALNAKPIRILPGGHRRPKRMSEDEHARLMLARGYVRYEVPDPKRKGEYFKAWFEDMEAEGYVGDHRLLRSADYGDPTIRQRLFVYFCRKDSGKRIVWPNPTHGKRDKITGLPPAGLKPWRTAREVIDWSLKGDSVFARKKALASNTFRRLAIGLVKYGLKEFLMPSHKGWSEANVRSADEPLTTLTTKSRPEGLVEPYVLPKDQGWQGDYVRDIDSPLGTTQTTSVDHLAEPCIIQMKGQSTAQSADEPLTALTSMQAHYVMEPQLDSLRGTGVTQPVSDPVRTITAGGQNQALAEAFMMAIDQTGGGKNHGTYAVDEPVRTIVTKNNASCIEFELVEVEERFLKACEEKGVDTTRAQTFLGFLVAELHKTGRLDAKPWIYVYYSNGSEGSDIDDPMPTVRTKAGTAVCYPVIELDGKMLRIDLLYRMLTPLELQRAMGFPDSMTWAGANQTEKIKAIGNSVSHGVARALGLAWYGQDENIAKYDEPEWTTSKQSH